MSEIWLLVLVSVPLLAVWLAALVEVLRRPDLRVAGKLGWWAALLFGGVFGLAAYVVVRPPRAVRTSGGAPGASRAEALVAAAEHRQRGELDDDAYRAAVERVAVID